MPTFAVFVEYVNLERIPVRDKHITQMEKPEDARKAAINKYKSLAMNGAVFINKIKRVR